jgi:large subunit ribosomal protein L10
MSKRIKEMEIAEIRRRIGDRREILVLNSAKLDAITANRFRLKLRESNITLLTVKNSLAKKALEESGLKGLDPFLEGPTTLVWGGEDVVALSKEISRWAKEIKELEIKGGTVEGTSLSPAGVEELSKSPSREELIGQIVGRVLGPGARLAGALLGPGGKLAGQLKTLSEEKGAESAAGAPQAG